MRSRRSFLVRICMARLCSRLADLLLQNLARIPHALLLVRIGLAEPADVRRDLSDELPVDPGHRHVRLLLDGDIDTRWDVEDHRMGIPEREDHLLALDLRAVSDADDVELLLKPSVTPCTAFAIRLRARPWNFFSSGLGVDVSAMSSLPFTSNLMP